MQLLFIDRFTQIFKHLPLRIVLVVPFVLQTVGVVGLTGYLCFRNGHEAVNQLADRLMIESGDRVHQTVTTYLDRPRLVNQIVVDAVARGELTLNLSQPNPQREQFLWQQMQRFDDLARISLGAEADGTYVGVHREPSDQSIQLAVANASTQSRVIYSKTTDRGTSTQPVKAEPGRYDPRRRPWYRAGVAAQQPTWTGVYPGYTSGTIFISASHPIYSATKQLLGVSSADLSLTSIQTLLSQTQVSRSAQVFIIERSGLLIASSSQEPVFQTIAGQSPRQLRASESQSPIVQATARHLQRISSSKKIDQRLHFSFQDQQRYFVEVLPLATASPNWLIVLAVPESDFMAQINHNMRQTLVLCVVALVLAVIAGTLTTRWVTMPLLQLQQAAQEVALGEFDRPVNIERSDEVGDLARSFNQMTAQLKVFFTAFEQSEKKFADLLESLPVGVCVCNAAGKITYINSFGNQVLAGGAVSEVWLPEFSARYQLYQTGTGALYPVDRLPIALALKGESITVEDMEVHLANYSIPLEVRSTPVWDETGNVQYAISLFQDISERLAVHRERQQAAAAIQRSEEQLRLALEFGQIASWDWELQTGNVTWNDNTFLLLGYPPGSIKPSHEVLRQHVYPEDLARVEQAVRTALVNRTDYQEEYRIIWRDGSLHWLVDKGRGVYSETGEVLRMVGIMIDITHRKCAEEALRESEARFRRLAENVPGVIYRYIMQPDGRDHLTYVSPRCREVFEVEPDAAKANAHTLWQMIHSEDAIALRTAVPPAIRALQPWSVDYRITTPSGQQKWLQNFAAPDLQPDGRVFWDGVVMDISDRKQVEELLSHYSRTLEEQVKERTEALQQSEARYRAILEDQTDLIVRLDTNGIITFANEAYARYFGVDGAMLVGQHFSPVIHEADQSYVFECLARICLENPVVAVENRMATPGGIRWAQWINRGFFDEQGVLVGVQSVGRDSHDRKLAEAELRQAKEAAEAANQAKSVFLANMSHELRTPLNAILGFSQLMAREALTPQQRKQIETINRNGEYLLQLINDVLSIAKIEAGRSPVQETCFDLHVLLNDIKEMFSLRAKLKNLELSSDRHPNVPQFIQADDRKLRQVLTNLLANAIKFTQQGYVILRVRRFLRSTAEQPDQPSLLFTIEDTGPGIAPDEIHQLFDAFVQAEAGIDSKQGTGLGLTICRHFVNLMGGEIVANSCLNKGTAFQFTLPFTSAQPASGEASPDRKIVGLASPSCRILVVDDAETNRQLMVSWLTAVGFEVKVANNGQSAIALWSAFVPDLIWMDVRMPIMDGLEATRYIRTEEAKATRRNTRSTKIIAITATVFEEEQQQILAAGYDDIIAKPCTEEAFLNKIRQHLQVKYRYEEETSRQAAPQSGVPTTVADEAGLRASLLEIMPQQWVHRLNLAARSADEKAIALLLQEIPDAQAEFKEAIAYLVSEFQLEQLIELTQPESI